MIDNAIIVDVEATRAVRQAEVGAARTMIERVMDRFDLYPERVAGDSAYSAAEILGWFVEERGIEPHVTVFDKSERDDGTFSRSDFAYDHEKDICRCPADKDLRPRWRRFKDQTASITEDGLIRYRARKADCSACQLKSRCCPRTATRIVLRSIHEGARDMVREIAKSEAGQP